MDIAGSIPVVVSAKACDHDNRSLILRLGIGQVVKAPVFEIGIVGSIPTSPAIAKGIVSKEAMPFFTTTDK